MSVNLLVIGEITPQMQARLEPVLVPAMAAELRARGRMRAAPTMATVRLTGICHRRRRRWRWRRR